VDYSPEHLLAGLDRFAGGIDGVYERYYETLLEMVSNECCTIVGHLDLVKKFNSLSGLTPKHEHGRLVNEILDRIAETGLVLEINSSGLDRPCREQYPGFGKEVGRHFAQIRKLLKQLGVTQLVSFDHLEAIPYEIK